MKAPAFSNRWRIEGQLTLVSPLHVGDGLSGSLTNRAVPASGDDVEVQTVCTDHCGKPAIPGSSIKGKLRDLAGSDGSSARGSRWSELLGSLDASTSDAVGGKLEFWDAHLRANAQPREAAPGPYFDPHRQTCVATSVSLDRRTRTAKEHLLFHAEYVPAGAVFAFQITGDNLEDADIAALIALLNGVDSAPVRAALGAGSSHGWGLWQWNLTEIARFSREQLKVALEQGRLSSCGYSLCTPLAKQELVALVGLAAKQGAADASMGERLVIPVRLEFAGPLLIRDPSAAKPKKGAGVRAPSANRSAGQAQEPGAGTSAGQPRPVDAVPIVDEQGRPMIPGQSMRGALRAQAERIMRTLGHGIPEPSSVGAGSSEGSLDDRAAAADPVSRVFGAPGWKAPLTVHRFTAVTTGRQGSARRLHQEFVAIDRFTGGAADEKKYDAEAFVDAQLEGQLELDLTRLHGATPSTSDPALGLLVLVLRDVAEGDVRFGSGDAKGYGVCSKLQVRWKGKWCGVEALASDEQVRASLEALRNLPKPRAEKAGRGHA